MVLLSFYRRGGVEAVAVGESRRRYSMFGSLVPTTKSYDTFKRSSANFDLYDATIHTAEIAVKARPRVVRARSCQSSESAFASLNSTKPSLTRASSQSNMSIRQLSATSSTDNLPDVAYGFNKPLPPIRSSTIGT